METTKTAAATDSRDSSKIVPQSAVVPEMEASLEDDSICTADVK